MASQTKKRSSYKFGLYAEYIACIWLILSGHKIIARRSKTPYGEIDIIALRAKQLLIIEVKARRHKSQFLEVLSKRQQYRLKRAGEFFAKRQRRLQYKKIRFDLIFIAKPFYMKYVKNFLIN